MLSPVESEYKVYVVENAERLTLQAQNALLTFLEEPPRNTYIFLLTESLDNILTTIKSRAQAINMEKFELRELEGHVLSLSDAAKALKMRDPKAFDGILMNAGGIIGAALDAFSGNEGEIAENVRTVSEICENICKNKSYHELYLSISKLPTDRRAFIAALEALMLALRDVSLFKFDTQIVPAFYPDVEIISELSKKTSSKKLLCVYNLITDAIQDATSNVGISSIVTSLSTKIKLL